MWPVLILPQKVVRQRLVHTKFIKGPSLLPNGIKRNGSTLILLIFKQLEPAIF